MQIRRFQASDYPTYESWFDDVLLNEQLGPMDRDWLEYVLHDSSGAQYSVLRQGELVAVVGVCLPVDGHAYYFVTDLAVRPDLRGNGIGRGALGLLLAHPDLQDSTLWRAGVMPENPAAQAFFTHLGWARREAQTPFDELIEFEYQRQPAVPGFR